MHLLQKKERLSTIETHLKIPSSLRALYYEV